MQKEIIQPSIVNQQRTKNLQKYENKPILQRNEKCYKINNRKGFKNGSEFKCILKMNKFINN